MTTITLTMDFLIQRFDFSCLLDQLDVLGVGFPFLTVSSINAHTSGVVAAVLQAMQTFDEDLKDLTASARHVIIQICKDPFRERKKGCFILDSAVKYVYLHIQQIFKNYGCCSAFQLIHYIEAIMCNKSDCMYCISKCKVMYRLTHMSS